MRVEAFWTRLVGSLVLAAALGGCSDTGHKSGAAPARGARRTAEVALSRNHPPGHAAPRAFVTAETKNRLYVVNLPSGRVVGAVAMPADPENVVSQSMAVIVSPRAGAVTLVDPRTLRRIAVIRGFGSPHIPATSPDGRYADVTDDARGTLTAIKLVDRRVVSRISVGAGAHHLSFRPDGRRLWIALGESARTIVMVETSNPARPRLIGRFDPGYAAHDLSFTPDAERVWITSAATPDVGVFRARDHHLLFRVPVGRAPQHVAFAGHYAYLTSGYGATIEKVAVATGRVLNRTRSPYGSFELDVARGYVTTSSLFRGTVAIFSPQLKLLRQLRLAKAARDVAITPGWLP